MIDERAAFAGMLWVLENSGRYQHQELAGELLADRSLPLLISVDEFIRRTAPTLNPSCTTIARYLRGQVGVTETLKVIDELSSTASDEQMRSGLRSLNYRLGQADA
ncbi:MAG: hypothetical protein QM811_18535 [Pirellulales bacterium]